MGDNLEILQDRIQLLQNATRIEQIFKGYSPDKKYVVFNNEKKYLLRTGNIEEYERKKTEFQILNYMQRIRFNLLDRLTLVY
jgi:aminoglycoside phosphotransferase (APT) family kinase protein